MVTTNKLHCMTITSEIRVHNSINYLNRNGQMLGAQMVMILEILTEQSVTKM